MDLSYPCLDRGFRQLSGLCTIFVRAGKKNTKKYVINMHLGRQVTVSRKTYFNVAFVRSALAISTVVVIFFQFIRRKQVGQTVLHRPKYETCVCHNVFQVCDVRVVQYRCTNNTRVVYRHLFIPSTRSRWSAFYVRIMRTPTFIRSTCCPIFSPPPCIA